MAQTPPIGPDAFPVTGEAFAVRATIDLETVYTRLLQETRRLLTDLGQQGLTGDALGKAVSDGLSALSDAPIEEAGRKAATEGFNLGRNLGIQRNLNAVPRVIRTEILDDNTCEPCRLLDGARYEVNSPEYFQDMPPNHCDGRELCRGFFIPEAA